ncbi:PREDICTED: MND1-interacting protein 1-like [Ipomoea nil]|uniref:MND1-interacting protein 1-like n=1 Tax=Ipomoea nil TaxID=35883 RepID=UPI00090101D9|nr:PREDICTED: MND1-interacting protein 1-like [Ipomoea nil]XP_019181645.1 PREDICTED: MND1-interacting protein 1-like [Ipomoea nil]
MACNLKDKHSLTNWRPHPGRPGPDHSSNPNGNAAERSAVPNSGSESGDLAQNPNPKLSGFFTDEKLEEMLLRKLEFACKKVISKLVSLGHDENVALKAVLSNGYWHGEKDALANIFQNSLSYFEDGNSVRSENPEHNFSDLTQLKKCTLAGMVCLLQQVKPHLSKGDAMWRLLLSELHVERASAIEIPNGIDGSSSNVEAFANAMFRFRGGCRFENGRPNEGPMHILSSLENEIVYPKKYNLNPEVKTLLKRNVGVCSAGLRENTKHLENQLQASLGSLNITETGGDESPNVVNDDDAIVSVVSKFRDLHIQSTETARIQIDQKDEAMLSLEHQIKDLERQVKERKQWAHEKAKQAAMKLFNDISELEMLRKERDEIQLLKKGMQAIEDNSMKKLGEMENELRKASGQVDRANSAVEKLENENAEIRAEMEASRLSASESQKTCMEATKREKKCLKKLSAIEKLKSKLQDDIAAEIHKISDLQKQLAQAEAGQKEAEVKWRQEQKAKEQSLAQVEEERRNREADVTNNKRNLEAMRLKIEIEFHRHKDDLHRLERELSQVKASEQTSRQHLQSHDLSMQNLNGAKSEGDIMRELDALEDGEAIDHDRRCIICLNHDVSVVFLPCAHQVLCAKCNNVHGKKGKAKCPHCQVPIQHRICVFGTSS